MKNKGKDFVIRTDLVYPELSYKIVGILFEVYNNLGPGYQEKYYQKAISAAFLQQGINFKGQLSAPIKFKDSEIGEIFHRFFSRE